MRAASQTPVDSRMPSSPRGRFRRATLPLFEGPMLMPIADALLLIAPGCPHCPAMLETLGHMVKAGELAELRVVNVAARPDLAAQLRARSVPWLKLGPFELSGVRSHAELKEWLARLSSPTAMTDYLHLLLREGRLDDAQGLLQLRSARLADLLPILANPEAAMNVRLGANAILESQAGSAALAALLPQLAELARHADARVRADACYFLGLSARSEAVPPLAAALGDADAEVREIAAEALAQMQRGVSKPSPPL